jgi:hypothetical protein
LADRGQRGLLEALRAMPRAGVVRSPGSFGIELRYAYRVVSPDKTETIVLLAQRPIDAQFQAQRPGVTNYPFTMAELKLDAKGEGEGALSLATKLTAASERGFARGQDYDKQPMALTQVKRANK